MKKIYIKPEIAFEDFSLNTSIAGDCEKHVDTYAKDACAIKGSAPGSDLFSTGIQGCDLDWELLGGGVYDGFCYHVPTNDSNLFNS